MKAVAAITVAAFAASGVYAAPVQPSDYLHPPQGLIYDPENNGPSSCINEALPLEGRYQSARQCLDELNATLEMVARDGHQVDATTAQFHRKMLQKLDSEVAELGRLVRDLETDKASYMGLLERRQSLIEMHQMMGPIQAMVDGRMVSLQSPSTIPATINLQENQLRAIKERWGDELPPLPADIGQAVQESESAPINNNNDQQVPPPPPMDNNENQRLQHDNSPGSSNVPVPNGRNLPVNQNHNVPQQDSDATSSSSSSSGESSNDILSYFLPSDDSRHGSSNVPVPNGRNLPVNQNHNVPQQDSDATSSSSSSSGDSSNDILSYFLPSDDSRQASSSDSSDESSSWYYEPSISSGPRSKMLPSGILDLEDSFDIDDWATQRLDESDHTNGLDRSDFLSEFADSDGLRLPELDISKISSDDDEVNPPPSRVTAPEEPSSPTNPRPNPAVNIDELSFNTEDDQHIIDNEQQPNLPGPNVPAAVGNDEEDEAPEFPFYDSVEYRPQQNVEEQSSPKNPGPNPSVNIDELSFHTEDDQDIPRDPRLNPTVNIDELSFHTEDGQDIPKSPRLNPAVNIDELSFHTEDGQDVPSAPENNDAHRDEAPEFPLYDSLEYRPQQNAVSGAEQREQNEPDAPEFPLDVSLEYRPQRNEVPRAEENDQEKEVAPELPLDVSFEYNPQENDVPRPQDDEENTQETDMTASIINRRPAIRPAEEEQQPPNSFMTTSILGYRPPVPQAAEERIVEQDAARNSFMTTSIIGYRPRVHQPAEERIAEEEMAPSSSMTTSVHGYRPPVLPNQSEERVETETLNRIAEEHSRDESDEGNHPRTTADLTTSFVRGVRQPNMPPASHESRFEEQKEREVDSNRGCAPERSNMVSSSMLGSARLDNSRLPYPRGQADTSNDDTDPFRTSARFLMGIVLRHYDPVLTEDNYAGRRFQAEVRRLGNLKEMDKKLRESIKIGMEESKLKTSRLQAAEMQRSRTESSPPPPLEANARTQSLADLGNGWETIQFVEEEDYVPSAPQNQNPQPQSEEDISAKFEVIVDEEPEAPAEEKLEDQAYVPPAPQNQNVQPRLEPPQPERDISAEFEVIEDEEPEAPAEEKFEDQAENLLFNYSI